MENFRADSEREVTTAANGGERRVTCASCGKQVAPGARFCVHCGAEQSVPTPIAVVAAASMSRSGRREAANAAHAEPVHRPSPRDSSAAPAADPTPLAPPAQTGVANDGHDSPTRPAYADAPQRRGLLLALLAACVVVAIAAAGTFIWRLEGERTKAAAENAAAPTTSPAAPTTSPAAPVAAPSASVEAPPATPPEPSTLAEPPPLPGAEEAQSNVSPPPAAPAHAETGAPVEIKPLPPHPAATRSAQPRVAPGKAPSAASHAQGPAGQSESASRSAPAPAAAPPVEKVGAAQPAASRGSVRWKRLDEELSQCTREDFIARVICGQRVRFRYCDGYWGKVPQCPGNPAPERGQ